MILHSLNLVWNPSEGFAIGSFLLRYYSLMFVVAFALGWFIMKTIFEKEKESIEKLDTLFIYTVFATLIGARLGHVIFYQSELFKEDFLSVFLPIKTVPSFEFTGFSGLASHGAAVAIILAMYFYSKNVIKKPMLWILDRIVIPVACGAIFVRIGNFINSEIIGKATDSSLGIKFVQDFYSKNDAVKITQIANPNKAFKALTNNPEYSKYIDVVPVLHPTQLYESFCYVFVFVILMFLYWKTDYKNKQGFLFGTFLVLLWTVRFFVEFLKESQGGFEKYNMFNALSTGQWLSLPFILIGVFYMYKAKK